MKWGLLLPYLSIILGLYIFKNGWLAYIIYHISILSVMVYSKKMDNWKNLLKGWDTKQGILAILFGFAGGLVLFLLEPIIGFKANLTSNLLFVNLSGYSWLIFIIYHSAVNPWFEEVFWRGMYGKNDKKLIWVDLIFAGYHMLVLALFITWYWLPLVFIALTLAGWFWRKLKAEYNGLLLPTISHMAADASIMIIIYLMSL